MAANGFAVSNINVSAAPGATANAAIVTIGWNGAFQIDVETTAHLLIDIAGFYLAY